MSMVASWNPGARPQSTGIIMTLSTPASSRSAISRSPVRSQMSGSRWRTRSSVRPVWVADRRVKPSQNALPGVSGPIRWA